MRAGVRITFRVRAVDGECQPVPGLEVEARYRYRTGPQMRSRRVTDGEGCALFDDEHPEQPLEACLFAGGRLCVGIAPVEAGRRYVLEL